jgi:PKD repeat protein
VGATNSATARPYADLVEADGPSAYWPLSEAAGVAVDHTGLADLTVNTGVTRRQAGAITGDSDAAYAFAGTSSGYLANASTTAVAGPQTFSVEAWFQTTTGAGGKIVGYGSARTGLSTAFDRHVYMDPSGRLYFGVHNGAIQVINTTTAYNDGKWHHVVGTLGRNGLAFYVDGVLVGQRAGVTSAQRYNGFWRVGGDATTTWPGGGTWFSGRIDEVAVYPTALTAQQVAAHNTAGRTGQVANAAPTAAFTSSAAGLVVSVDGSTSADADGRVASYAWEFGDGGTGTGATASHTYAAAGTYQVELTVTDDKGATGSVTRAVTVTAPQPPAEEPPAQQTPFAVDSFGRTVTGGWGTADVGGAWTIAGSTASPQVVNGAGQISGAAGKESRAGLAGVSQQEVAVQADITLPQAATGGGAYISLAGRRIGTSDYRATLRFQASGLVDLRLDRMVNGTETVLRTVRIPGTYTAGTPLTVRLELTGNGTTTLKGKAWAAGTTEPADWTVTTTDSTAALQAPGGVYLETYTASTATRTQVFRIDDLRAGAAGETPAVR